MRFWSGRQVSWNWESRFFLSSTGKIGFPRRDAAFGGRPSNAGIRWQRSEWLHQCCCWCWCSLLELFAHGGSGVAATRSQDAHHLLRRTEQNAVIPRRASLWISPPWRRTWITSWHKSRTLRSPCIRARRRSSTTTWSWTFWRIRQSPATTEVLRGRYNWEQHYSAVNYGFHFFGSQTGQSRVSCAAVHRGTSSVFRILSTRAGRTTSCHPK